jgi:hypothetical protein
VVGGGDDRADAPDLAPGQAQALEGLRAGHLVHQVAVDVEHRRCRLLGVDDVLVPELVVERAGENERDPNFQGYGVDRTDAGGTFRFRTILPVAYPGRTPHIHVRVQPVSGRALATQLYLPGDPGNARDFLFSRLTADEQQALLLAIEPTRVSQEPLARATRFTARTELVLA